MRIAAVRDRRALEALVNDGVLKFGSAGVFYNSENWVRDCQVFVYEPDATVTVDESGVYVNGALEFVKTGENWSHDGELVEFSGISIEIA